MTSEVFAVIFSFKGPLIYNVLLASSVLQSDVVTHSFLFYVITRY